ncbi:MAG TPA: hypothetical protein VIT22_06660 [Pseudoxanthomonas sp.]
MPEDWNGDLVMYLHGYEPKGTPRTGEIGQKDLGEWLLSGGYAVAQSSYSTQGWAVAEAQADNERLRQQVVALYGKPRRTFLIGHSMGGHLVLASLERHPDAYDGALALCGANAPAAEIFADGVAAPLIAFDYFFPGALGLAPGGLADSASPPGVDPAALETALKGNEAHARVLAERFDLLREDLAGALMIRYLVLHEMTQRAGGFPVDNRDVAYAGFGDDNAFNAGVRRYSGDAQAMAYARNNASLTGQARKPVVVLSNLNDPTVPEQFSSRYAALAKAVGNDSNVVVLPPRGKGHCAFTPEDVDQAFDALATWVGTGNRPASP